MLNKEGKQNEISTSPSQQLLQKIEVLAQANNLTSQLNDYFSTKKLPDPSSSLLTLTEFISSQPEIPETQKREPFPFSQINLNDLSSSQLLTYLQSLEVNEKERKEIVSGWLAGKIFQFAQFKQKNMGFEEDVGFPTLPKDKKFLKVLREIKNNNFYLVEDFYHWLSFYLPQIEEATTNEKLEQIEKDISTLAIDQKIKERLMTLIEKRKRQASKDENKDQTEREKEKEFNESFQFSLDYLAYAGQINKDTKTMLMENTIKIINYLRNLIGKIPINITLASYELAEIFWHMRLKRRVDLDKFPALKKIFSERLRQYYETITLDKSLHTEAAGFWFETNLDLSSFIINNNLAIARTIKNFLTFFEGTRKTPFKITININDRHFIKITIHPQDSEEKIREIIEQSLGKKIEVDPKKITSLKREAFSHNKRKRSRDYRDLFYHQVRKHLLNLIPYEANLPGDIMIRLVNEEKPDKTSPETLFIVDDHKILLNLDLSLSPIANFSMKFSHHYFDGGPAKKIFQAMIDLFKKQGLCSQTYPEPSHQEKDDKSESFEPLTEANHSIIATVPFNIEKIEKEGVKLTPTFLIASGVALANDIDNFHLLVAAKTKKITNGPHENVQPVIVSFKPILEIYKKYKKGEKLENEEREAIKEWVRQTFKALEYGKKGLSIAAVLSAITGTWEKIFSKIGEKLHHGTLLLTQVPMMFSPLPELKTRKSLDFIRFFTAKSDSYGLDIDLDNPQKAVGVIGFSQSFQDSLTTQNYEASFSLRKIPSQAQVEFRNFIDEIFSQRRDLKQLYQDFSQLLSAWEKLITGEINMERYQRKLNSLFQKYKKELQKHEIGSKETLQIKLNEILSRSAQNNLNEDSLRLEIETFYRFLKDALNN